MIRHTLLALAIVLVYVAAAFAQADFDRLYSADKPTFTDTIGVPAAVPAKAKANPVETLQVMPILDLMAERNIASKELALGTTVFLATAVLDDNWDTYFQIRLKGSRANPGVWKEASLKDGVTYKYDGGEVKIKEQDGFIGVMDSTAAAQTSMAEIFELLYTKSSKIEFGGAVTYAVIRNFTPLTGNEGTITLRLGSDGLYYYSLTPDTQVASAPRWLLAVNGVLYGLKATDTDIVFVSKVIEQKSAFLPLKERTLKF